MARCRLLPGRTSRAPDADASTRAVPACAADNSSRTCFLEQVELRLVAKETGFVDGEVFEQRASSVFAFAAGQQPVVAVERIQPALLQAALQAVLQEMGAALVEEHAAFLVDERLQQLQFCFGQLSW